VQQVKIALAEGSTTILDSGLQPGEKVVVDGADRLRTGQPVIATLARTTPSLPQAPAAVSSPAAPKQAKP
jgi:multidrug efflux system membrane fusion protein